MAALRKGASDESVMAKCAECCKPLYKPTICRKCRQTLCHDHSSPRNHPCKNRYAGTGSRLGRLSRKGRLVTFGGLATAALVSIMVLGLGLRTRPDVDWNGQTLFVDVTQEAGVGYAGSGHGLALGDYDNDGDVDIYVVTKHDPNVLYRNDGDGTFTDITESSGAGDTGGGHGAAFVDYDNDGDLDIYVANWAGRTDPNSLYRNDGNDTFTNVNKASGISGFRPGGSHGCIVLDFNNDGLTDLFATSAEETCILLRNKGDGTFEDYSEKSGLRYGARPHFQSTIDINGDGYLDILVSNSDPEDGDEDSPNEFYRNTGLGTFMEASSSAGLSRSNLHGAFFGDFDGDGDIDLFAPDAARGSKLTYLENDGKGRFKDATRRSGTWHSLWRTHGMACGDFDNDGDMDAFLTSGIENLFFANAGDGTFAEIAEEVGLGTKFQDPKAVGFLDYDNDGDLDIYVVAAQGANRLFRNDHTEGNWIKIELVGTKSNRDAIGARIELVVGDRRQVREICGGRGHMQDPFEQFFGLGNANTVESISIRWPSGRTQQLLEVPANQRLVVTEDDQGG